MYYCVELLRYYDDDTLEYCDSLEEAQNLYNWYSKDGYLSGVRAGRLFCGKEVTASFNFDNYNLDENEE